MTFQFLVRIEGLQYPLSYGHIFVYVYYITYMFTHTQKQPYHKICTLKFKFKFEIRCAFKQCRKMQCLKTFDGL